MSKITLYRKYRPQSFSEIVNQDHIKETIQQEIISEKLPHAFLFYGPRGVGKTTTARILAKTLNCKKRKPTDSEPCNTCDSCEAMTSGSSLSLVEVDAASQTGVDNVRENIIANARVAVKSGEYKVFIIDEVHMLSTSSFNALLKTLEEPPERVIFILATTEIHKIPETIISRCQRFDFHTVKPDLMYNHLKVILEKEEREVDDDVVKAIVKKGAGFARDTISLLGQVLTISGKITAESAAFVLPITHQEHLVTFFDHISQGNMKEGVDFIHYLQEKGIRPVHFSDELIDFGHDLLLFLVGSSPKMFRDHPQKDLVETIAQRYSPQRLLQTVDTLLKRSKQCKDLDRGFLPIELAIVELVGPVQVAAPPPQQPIQPIPSPASPAPPKTQQLADNPAPTPSAPVASPAPAKPVETSTATKTEVAVKVETKKAPLPTSATAAPTTDLPLAEFAEAQMVWPNVLTAINKDHHSLFIVLRTGNFRESADGGVEIAFRFRMHFDHVKKSQNSIREHFEHCLNGKTVSIKLAVDDSLQQQTMGSEVEEPDQEEQEMISTELNRIADAFGGALME